ncbi:MAG: FKBP-type peptidyl-prolyl cis-trans isomerase [Myxococcota bacterium]
MSNRVAMIVAAVMLVLALGLAVWGTSEPAVAPPVPIPTEAPAPAHPWQDAARTPVDGLEVAVLTEGSGRTPVKGDVVTVAVKGWVEENGHLFVERSGADGPLLLGEPGLTEGAERSLLAMKVGEKRQVRVPPELGFGQTGQLPRVPRDASLIYELELLSVEDAPVVPDAPPSAAPDRQVDGVGVAVLHEGAGAEAKSGDAVSLNLTTWLEDGTFVDSTLKSLRPVDVTLGSGQLYAGLESAVVGMKAGEQRKAVIPASLAFGDSGRGPIPPGSTLIVVVELLRIR